MTFQSKTERMIDELDNLDCGACTVAIGAHTYKEGCALQLKTHWYAACAMGWAVSEVSRDDAIKRMAPYAGINNAMVRRCQKRGQPGAYVWSCRVLAPKDASYGIREFMPHGVDTDKARHSYITHITTKGAAIWHPKDNKAA